MEKDVEKKNAGLVVLIVILFVLVVGLSCFVVCDKFLFNDKTSSTNEHETNDKEASDYNNSNDSSDSKLLSNEEALVVGKRLYDKATEIYETWVFIPYCGVSSSDIHIFESESLGDGDYFRTAFRNLDEMRGYLKQWLSDDILNQKILESIEDGGKTYSNYVDDLSLLSGDNSYPYVDYVLKDNSLYCRLHQGKGWVDNYYGQYDIKVDKIEENRITYTIVSTYVKEDSECQYVFDGGTCKEEELEYENTKFVIEKNEIGEFVVSEYTLHH